MNIVKKVFDAGKWVDRDHAENKHVFLMAVIAMVVLVLPLTGLLVITSDQSTKISAQVAPPPPPPPPPACGAQCTNLTVSWTRPSAVAQFVDSKGKIVSCTSTALTCTATGAFAPNSDINYTVRVKNSTGAVLKMGTAKVNPKKQATASWNWTYAVAVYPSTFTDCTAAGIQNQCLTKTVTNDSTQNSVVYNDAKAATEYMIYVCAPSCGAGTVVLQTKQTTPALPTPTPSPTSSAYCKYVGSSVIQPGAPIAISHSGFTAGESVRLFGSGAQLTLGTTISSLDGIQTQQIAVPSSLVPGSYVIMIVTRFPIVNFTCGDVEIIAPTPTPPSSTMNLTSAVSGSTVSFTMNPGANSSTALIVYNSSNTAVHDSGALNSGQATYAWIATQPAGVYHAQVFAFGITPVSNVTTFTLGSGGI